eukprot:s563_g6.t3
MWDPIHKFLWHATDVNTGATSVTKARHCRIDVVQYLSSHMEVLDVMPMPKLKDEEVREVASHSLQWIQRQAKDRWVQRAHERLYRSRAAFKLKQLDVRYSFLTRRAVVIDLGCHAGGWSQIVLERVNGREGLVIGAPRMSGSKMDDHISSVELNRSALRWALKFLRSNGCFVTKVFQGGSLEHFKAELEQHFDKVRFAKPSASRPESSEIYLVIPNAEHPSDHFPVFVTFMLKDGYEKHRECARAWLECVAGREKVHPLSNEELRDAFEFFDRDRDENIHLQDLEEACFELRSNFHVDVPTLLLECFPENQISFEDFLRAYEASLRTDRLRAVGDLECAFRYFAGDAQSIHIDTLEAAFREITPISFSDDEVKDMIGRVSGRAQASVHLHDFCEVVCKATFPNREGREALVASTPKVQRSPHGRMGTKEIGNRLHHLQKAVSGKGLQVDLSPDSDDGSNLNKFFEED